jgi:hypothetical protein
MLNKVSRRFLQLGLIRPHARMFSKPDHDPYSRMPMPKGMRPPETFSQKMERENREKQMKDPELDEKEEVSF